VLKLADPDTVSASNLNRMRFDFTQLGVNKAELIAQYIYQLNPYAEIDVYAEGINGNNMDSFLNGLDVLVEELDDIEVKIKMREGARKRKIPVIMATDSSDNVILDIERFDLHPGAPVFHGVLTGMDLSDIKTNRTKLFEAMGRIIDLRLITERQLGSVREVGKTIYSWPQLATAATASGAVLAYAIRRIVLDQPLIEGKCKLNLDALLDSDYSETMRKQRRVLAKFMSEMSVPFGVRGGILALWKKIFSKK
jgi:hypothetical protein